MQKAVYFEEAYNKGMLPKIDSGYILSVLTPDLSNVQKTQNPIHIEIISYSGVKSVQQMGNGAKFLAAGKKMFCLIEPAGYSKSHIEPALRSTSTTEHIPFRFSECEKLLTSDNKFRVLLPRESRDCYDSFTVDFPDKGDICILYMIFDEDINGKVLPFIQENFSLVLKNMINLQKRDADKIAKHFIQIVQKFDVWTDK